jgi:urease accessory protein
MTQGIRLAFGSLALTASASAWAHVGVHADGGLVSGFAHPFLGLDHLLAMVAVGIWAVQIGGRCLLGLPAAFVTFMAVGAALGAAGVSLPQVEGMVALSVLALGCAVGSSVRLAWHWAVPLVAAFALFHGHAHGTEMPAFATPWQYFIGIAVATAMLHALGVVAASALKKHPALVRAGGAAIGVAGSWLLLAGLA